MTDVPFKEALDLARPYLETGADVYQKFTCQHCGNRLTMDVPNVFYMSGDCDNCGKVTNIEERGCGFLLHMKL